MSEIITEQPTRLYVGNIDYRMTIQQLELLFAQFGLIEDVFLPAPEASDEAKVNRGFAFVRFSSSHAANAALKLNQQKEPTFKRKLVIQPAKPRPEK